MSAPVSSMERASILAYAASLTINRADPVAVAATAIPLLEWLEAARDEEDVKVRVRAMRQHHFNICAAHDVLAGDPDAFLEGARVLYAFMTAGGTS